MNTEAKASLDARERAIAIQVIAIKVIAVVSVLSAMTFVIYSYVESDLLRKSQRHCASNLKSIGLAMQQYAQDYDETLPRSWFGRDAGASGDKTNYKWMDAIHPYAKETRFFVCPADRNENSYQYRSGARYGSYVMNNAYFAPGDKYTPPSGLRLSEIENTGLTVLITDGANDFQFAWPDVSAAPSIIEGYPRTLGAISGRHQDSRGATGFAMPLYCDGHVLGNRLEYIMQTKQDGVYTGFTIEGD